MFRPTCFVHRFAGSLNHVAADSVFECRGRTLVSVFKGPGTKQGLVHKILIVRLGSFRPVVDAFFVSIQPAPDSYLLAPKERQFGKYVDSGTHILGSLGVMGRGGDHLMWPKPGALLNFAVEFLRGNAEAEQIAADLVERNQSVVAVEAGIFEALR